MYHHCARKQQNSHPACLVCPFRVPSLCMVLHKASARASDERSCRLPLPRKSLAQHTHTEDTADARVYILQHSLTTHLPYTIPKLHRSVAATIDVTAYVIPRQDRHRRQERRLRSRCRRDDFLSFLPLGAQLAPPAAWSPVFGFPVHQWVGCGCGFV